MKPSSSTPVKSSIDKSHSIPIVTQYAEPGATDHAAVAVEIAGDSSGSDSDINAIRVGAWETGLFCCLGASVGLWVNTCLAWCLPCVSFAQITHRLGLAKFWIVLIVFTLLVVADWVLLTQFLAEDASSSLMWQLAVFAINKIYTAATSEELHVENLYLQDTELFVFVSTGMWAFAGVGTGALMIVLAWVLRTRVRTRFGIPGSCCLDGLAAFFCSCCSVSQLATHLKIHKKRKINIGPADTLPPFPLQ